MKNEVDVLISGGGPTGLLLAYLLARQDVSVRIFDDNPGRVKESRAMAIQAMSLELFQKIGIVDEFLKRGMPAGGMSLHIRGRDAIRVTFDGIGREDTPYKYVFMLSQAITEEILENALKAAGVTIERNSHVESFEQTSEMVSAKIRRADGTIDSAQAKYLVGCDGARSQVRKSLGLHFEGGTYDAEFLLGDVTVDWAYEHDRIHVFVGKNDLGIFFPLDGVKRGRVIAIDNAAAGTAAAAEHLTTKQTVVLKEVSDKFKAAVEAPVEIREAAWVTRYRVHHRAVEKMRVGRVFVAGDAAHIHSPTGGQGMNTGLQDAANLAWKLALVLKGGPDVLDTYHSERWPVAQRLLKFTDRLFGAVLGLNSGLKDVLRVVGPLIGKIASMSFVPRYLFGFVSQLNIHYHPSAVAQQWYGVKRKRKLARAGHRAPDAPLGDGRMLFDLLNGYKFTVLVMSRETLDAQARAEVEKIWRAKDTLGRHADIHWFDLSSPVVLDRYDVDDELLTLVRPDGYIGYQQNWL